MFYADVDGGSDPSTCDPPQGTFETLPLISIRTHVGQSLMDPCGGCLAYVIMGMHKANCTGSTCDETLTLDTNGPGLPTDRNLVGTSVKVFGNPYWADDPAYEITAVDPDLGTITIGDVARHPSCDSVAGSPSPCASVAEVIGDSAEVFTLAGEGGSGTDSPYYTMHAEFWNTWYQEKLAVLEDDCLATTCDASGGSEVNVTSNYFVDALP